MTVYLASVDSVTFRLPAPTEATYEIALGKGAPDGVAALDGDGNVVDSNENVAWTGGSIALVGADPVLTLNGNDPITLATAATVTALADDVADLAAQLGSNVYAISDPQSARVFAGTETAIPAGWLVTWKTVNQSAPPAAMTDADIWVNIQTAT